MSAHQYLSRRHLDRYPIELAQKTREGIGIVGIEDPAHLQRTQLLIVDMNGCVTVTIELIGDIAQALMIKRDLSSHPGGTLANVGDGRNRQLSVGIDTHLFARPQAEGIRRDRRS